MEQRKLGRTGLTVTRLGLGLAALGRPGYINLGHGTDLPAGHEVRHLRRHCHEVLDVAWAAGVRYFDAARSYGLSESFLDWWLTDRWNQRNEVVVGSKWGYTCTADWRVDADKHEIKDHSLSTLRRQWNESVSKLFDLKLYQIHSATLESGVLDDYEVLSELAGLKMTVKIGLTLTGPAQAETLRKALAVEIDGKPLFDCVQATWNLLEPSVGPALAEAHAAGLGVIVKEALANGRLTTRNPDEKLRPLSQLAAERETTVDALALAAALAQPWADVVLSGAATAAQLHSNLRALDVAWDGALADSPAGFRESPEEYWQTRSRLPWN